MLAVIIAACKKDDFVEVAGVCPIVVSTNPLNGATGVPLEKIISITFNEEMNPATITQTSVTLAGTAPVTGTVTYNGMLQPSRLPLYLLPIPLIQVG